MWELAKESFTRNIPNTVLIIAVFIILNGKLNKILINEGIYDTKIEQLEKIVEKDHDEFNSRISSLEKSFSAHIGDAYIREED